MNKPIKCSPVFPLGTILFPGIPLDLKIFEQRYLELVKESLKSSNPFVIAPIIKGKEVGETPEVFPYGVLVNIIDWSQLSGGLLGITVQGNTRVALSDNKINEQNLMLASIRKLPLPNLKSQIEAHDFDLLEFFNEITSQMGSTSTYTPENLSLGELIWRLAYILPLSREDKYKLLKTDSAATNTALLRRILSSRIKSPR